MHLTHIIKTAAGGLSLLVATSGFAAIQSLPVNYVSIPAYNLITDTLFNLSPLEAGKRNPFLLNMVCELARGDISQRDAAQRLAQANIDPQKLAQTGTLGKLILTGESSDRQLACVAYMATSLFLPTDTATYFQKMERISPEGTQPKAESESPSWLPWKSSKKPTSTGSENLKDQSAFNQPQFNQDKITQLAIARATAQLYGVIAQNIPKGAGDWATRQRQIADIVRFYAADYLQSVISFYTTDAKSTLTLEHIALNGYSVSNAGGNRLVKTGADPQLLYQGVTWLGNGKIIGKEYFVDITLFPASSIKRAADGKKSDGVQKKK